MVSNVPNSVVSCRERSGGLSPQGVEDNKAVVMREAGKCIKELAWYTPGRPTYSCPAQGCCTVRTGVS